MLLGQKKSLIDLIRTKDRFIHVPYHSFDAYIQLLREAAISKEVKSIKTTLYRLAKDSQVIKALKTTHIAHSVKADTILVPTFGLADGIINDLMATYKNKDC